MKAVSAAAVGAILGASVILGRLAIGDWFTGGVGLLSAIVLFRWRVPPPAVVAVGALAGLVAFHWLRPTWLMVR